MMIPIATTIENHSSDALANDLRLIQTAATGDRGAQRRLVERVLPRVKKTVQYLSGGRSDAEDLAQLALIQIVRSAKSFRGDSTLDYWTDRVVVQTLSKQFEKRSRRQRIRESFWIFPPRSPSADEQACMGELREKMRDHLGKLTPPLRTVVVMFCIHGYTAQEIAEMTNTKINTVRGRIRVGIKGLRKRILSDPSLREWVESGTT